MSKISISELIEFNPKRLLKRGAVAPFVDMAAISESDRDIQTISEREFKGGGSRFRNGDTLFARITPCLENGKTAKVNGLPDDVIGHGSTEFIVLAPKDDSTDEDYVYYLARLPEFRSYAQARMEGTSGRQRVSWQALSEFEVDFLPAKSRKKIGDILKKFDDKIQLNHQINQTLEQIAQALFKSWFVDFDPVKAKIDVLEAGGSEEEALLAAMQVISSKNAGELAAFEVERSEEYAQLRATAALFPAAMVESELGEVPREWSVSFLSDVSEITYGKNLPTKKLLNKGFPVFGGNGIIGFFDEFIYEEPMTLVSCRGAASGKVLRSLPKSFVTNNSLVVNHNKKGYLTQLYLEEALKRYGLTELTSGSAQPQMTIQNMAPVQIIIPSEDIIVAHKELVAPLFNQILQKQNENEALKDLRDTLLPRLLSGELDVSELAESLEAEA